MKNTRNLIVVLFLMAAATLGCSMLPGGGSGGSSGGANSSSTPETTGIPDCDKLVAAIEEYTSDKNKEASFIEKAAYNLIKDQIMKPLRDDIANKTETQKKDIGLKCREAMTKLDEQKAKDEKK